MFELARNILNWVPLSLSQNSLKPTYSNLDFKKIFRLRRAFVRLCHLPPPNEIPTSAIASHCSEWGALKGRFVKNNFQRRNVAPISPEGPPLNRFSQNLTREHISGRIIFQISSELVTVFPFCESAIFAVSHQKAWSPLTRCCTTVQPAILRIMNYKWTFMWILSLSLSLLSLLNVMQWMDRTINLNKCGAFVGTTSKPPPPA